MKLLLITQKIDQSDPILGFFHSWAEELAKYFEKITIIALSVGEYNLPENVKVLSLGKESGKSRIKYLFNFFRYIWETSREYDGVFVHMNPEYVILGSPFWFLRKKVFLWYTHSSVDLKLRLAEKLADHIFTASKESFRLPSSKVIVTGHGIDPVLFGLKTNNRAKNGIPVIVTSGRISGTKNLGVIIESVYLLKSRNFPVILKIYGVPATEEDRVYAGRIKKEISGRNMSEAVIFAGQVKNSEMPEILRSSDIFVNASGTGSADKAVLEALSCGIPVITSNEAFRLLLTPLGLFFENGNSAALAEKIKSVLAGRISIDPEKLHSFVSEGNNLKVLISKISSIIQKK